LVVGATAGNRLSESARQIDKAAKGIISDHLPRSGFKGGIGETVLIPLAGRGLSGDLLIAGLGSRNPLSAEDVRRAAGAAAKRAGRYSSVTLDLGQEIEASWAAAEGFLLGSYVFDKYQTEAHPRVNDLAVCGATDSDLEAAKTVCEATMWARDLVNEPPSNRNPAQFLEACSNRAQGSRIKVEVLDEIDLAKRGFDGILTVGRGSQSPPRFATLTYDPRGAKGFVGLVGKGITFDSGGLSLKTAEGMETMKMDCSGAAAVVAAVTALAELGAKIKVVAAIAVAENMPGPLAVKPGDVIKHFGGKTSEVLNTDAEGRLVLADALAWMSEQKPDAMVDVATLTGGMVVALGQKVAGVMSNRPSVAAELLQAAAQTGEAAWEMPLIHEYREQMDSSVADIKNISGSRWASPIFGGLFLNDFVGDTPWAHLDIAGPAWSEDNRHYLRKGATGFGARLLIDWVLARAAAGVGGSRAGTGIAGKKGK